MKKIISTLLFLLPLALLAQSPFDGTWKTNLSEAKLSPKPFIYVVNNGMYDCDSCAPKIHVKADGTDQPVKGQTYDTLAVKVVDANTVQTVSKKGGDVTTESTRTASTDGKAMTVDITNHPQNGQTYKTQGKFTRLSKGPAGSNATSGSWRLDSLEQDESARTATWKVSGDTATMSTGDGENWEAKVGGGDAQVKGIRYNETVSVKKLNDHSLELTYKRDGKVDNVQKLTVSADGKKLTRVVESKTTGRVSTYTDDKQ